VSVVHTEAQEVGNRNITDGKRAITTAHVWRVCASGGEPHRIGGGFLDPKMLWKSLPDALKKLDPRVMVKNPVMFVVEAGSVLTTWQAIAHPSVFAWVITVWLWLTVVFANLAEAVAKARGVDQATVDKLIKDNTTGRALGFLGWGSST